MVSRTADRTLEGVEGVELVDVDDRAELARVYGRSWVSALPSVGEAFGLVLLEAMACGTPVVGSDVLGIPEVVDRPEVGRLFSGDDPAQALLEAIELADGPRHSPGLPRARRGALDRALRRPLPRAVRGASGRLGRNGATAGESQVRGAIGNRSHPVRRDPSAL